VAHVSQIAVDRGVLIERVGHLGEPELPLVLAGMDVVLGRDRRLGIFATVLDVGRAGQAYSSIRS
jgi:hypothetical protein